MGKFQIVVQRQMLGKGVDAREGNIYKIEEKSSGLAIRWVGSEKEAKKVLACAEKEGYRGRC
jgi:NMD protein affecting ribosome stability and mRNA decay